VNIDVLRVAVLTALVEAPQHGYGILADVQAMSDGTLSPPVGSMYRIIDNLLRDGLIVEHSNDVVNGRFRRYYALTTAGHQDLERALDAISSVATSAKRRLRDSSRPTRTAIA
jgi:DNA-binding PadR family transcriptional regulator